jgi:hypothetical protein
VRKKKGERKKTRREREREREAWSFPSIMFGAEVLSNERRENRVF